MKVKEALLGYPEAETILPTSRWPLFRPGHLPRPDRAKETRVITQKSSKQIEQDKPES